VTVPSACVTLTVSSSPAGSPQTVAFFGIAREVVVLHTEEADDVADEEVALHVFGEVRAADDSRSAVTGRTSFLSSSYILKPLPSGRT
jgi:hypothetical protein